MALIINDLLCIPSAKDKVIFRVASSDPATGIDGQLLINTTTNEIKVWYSSGWNVLGITITPAALEYLLLETGDFLLKEDGDKLAKG